MKLDLTISNSYDIASALRGPDSHSPYSDLLKEFTTAVLRYFCGMLEDSSLIVISPGEARYHWEHTPYQTKLEVAKLWFKEHHFMRHWHLGMFSLSIENPEVFKYREWLEREINEILNP